MPFPHDHEVWYAGYVSGIFEEMVNIRISKFKLNVLGSKNNLKGHYLKNLGFGLGYLADLYTECKYLRQKFF